MAAAQPADTAAQTKTTAAAHSADATAAQTKTTTAAQPLDATVAQPADATTAQTKTITAAPPADATTAQTKTTTAAQPADLAAQTKNATVAQPADLAAQTKNTTTAQPRKTATDKYDGETEQGRFHGRGTLTRADGSVWQGTWRNGKPHGEQFLQILPGAFRYEGGMSAGKRHGRGKETRADGCGFEGTWRMGKRVAVTGEDADGRVLQSGARTLSDGSTVRGSWSNGKWQGRCLQVLPGKFKFECDFVDGVANGRGVLVYDSGMHMKGEWRAGEFCKGEIVEQPGGNVYRGEVSHGLRHGEGEMVRPQKKLTLRGTWREGALYGLVQEECGDEYTFSGLYERGFRHGPGMLTSTRTKWMLLGAWTHGVLGGSVVITRAGAEHVASLQAEYDAARGGLCCVRACGVNVCFHDIFPAAWIDTRAATLFDDTVECVNRLLRIGKTTAAVAQLLAVTEAELVDWFAEGVGKAAARTPAHEKLTHRMRAQLHAARGAGKRARVSDAGDGSAKRPRVS